MSTAPDSRLRTQRWWRAVLPGLIVAFLALLSGPAASAAPIENLAHVPADLQKYVPNTPMFASAPWMTSPTCKDKGGDFSIWASNVITDTPSLLAYFQASQFGPETKPEDKPRSDAIIAGYRQLATEVPAILPTGYCVDDMKRWTSPDSTATPFGFPWGVTDTDGHQTNYYCTDRTDPNATRNTQYNHYFGAERAMCDGFYVSCTNAQENEKARCEAWNTFSDEYVRRVDDLRAKALNDHKVGGVGDKKTELKTPGEVVGDIAGGWFEDLTKTIAEGTTKLMAEAMSFWTRTDRTAMLQSPAIANIQGLLRYVGIALLVGSVIWQGLVMMYKRKVDPLISTGVGLLSFVGWSTLGGTVAILINEAGIALANNVLDASIDTFSKTVGDSLLGQVGTATGAIFFLSIIMLILSGIQWVLGFFRMGALVILLALLPTAAAGQATESTKPWLRKVLSWCLSLILYQPIAAIIYSVGLNLLGSGDLSTVLVGMAVIALAVIAMPTMLRFFDWGGQKLVNSGGGGGGAMAVGAAASALGGGGIGGFSKFMDRNGPASGGGGGQSSGALPVSPAHAGDGPGGSTGNGGSPSTSGPGGGPQGGPGAQKQGVSPATGGQPGGGGGQTPVGAGVAGGGGGQMAAGAGAGGGAMAAHPAGAAAMAANEGKDTVKQAFTAAAGAMTEGAESGGPQ